MTAKEAVESLMAKDPKNPTIRSLKEQGLRDFLYEIFDFFLNYIIGLLEEILYPDGRPGKTQKASYAFGYLSPEIRMSNVIICNPRTAEERRGREGGRSMRSIAKPDRASEKPRAQEAPRTPRVPSSAAESDWNVGGGAASSEGGEFYRAFDKKQSKAPSKAEEDDIDRQVAVVCRPHILAAIYSKYVCFSVQFHC